MFSDWLNEFVPVLVFIALIYFFITYIIHDAISYYVNEIDSATPEQIGEHVSSRIMYELITGLDHKVELSPEDRMPVDIENTSKTAFMQLANPAPRGIKRSKR